MLAPGDPIGRFVIVEQIGQGGMGDVYRARDAALMRDVAVKVLRQGADLPTDRRAAANARLLGEARAAAAFAHTHVVAIYDVGETPEGLAYLAMELVDGVSLRRIIGDASIPLAQRMQWLADVARVLEAAHARGLIHRDVKPENVMIRKDGTVKVLDFGLARRIDVDPAMSTTAVQALSTISTHGNAAGRTAGTPLYMAPEQMRGEPVDRRADQFSWGVMAYELLSGELPWGSRNDQLQLLANLMSTDPPPLTERDARILAQVSGVVQRAIAKLPGQRFPSMAAVLDALGGRTAAPSDTSPGDAPSLAVPDDVAPGDATLAVTTADATSPGPPVTTISAGPRRTRAPVAGLASAVLVVGAVLTRCWIDRSPPTPSGQRPGAGSSAPRCTSHAACTARAGAPSRCFPEAGCVALAGDSCQVLAEPADITDDRTVFFGAIMPLGKDSSALPDLHAMDLARRDFATMMRGFGADGSYGHIHRLALVACDEARGVERGVHHLVDDVRVPVIIGFSSGAKLIELAGSTLEPRGVLVIAPFTTSPLLRTLPRVTGSPRMVYRTTYDSSQTARALAAAIPAIFEPELRASPGIVDRAHPLRVALVRQSATRLSAFAGMFFDALRFNDKSALDNGASYRELTYDETDPESPTAGYAVVRDALVAFAPHVIVYVGDDQMTAGVVVATERAWTTAAYRPRWLGISFITHNVLAFVDRDPARRHRFFGISEATNRPANARFVLHYNEIYPEPIDRAGGPNTSYDAFYVAAYAPYALDSHAAVTGTALAGAMRRLIPPGRPIDVGAAAIFEAFSALQRGENIDLNGAAGSLDFDLDTGDAPIDQALLCIAVDAQGRALGSMESGVIHDARVRALRGALHCP